LKVTHGGSNVIASQGIQSEAQFQILASAHAFRILSSGLYSDKIGAVLREIGCNAADSHIAAGIADRPIEVKLPTQLDNQFYIKDWGLGLTHAEITGLFTTYFSSNKSETNDMTGAFGLGSKSPFSYTDSFAVTSAKDGVQRSYTAHIGADGSPVISLLAETPVQEDWKSGLMVSFPVEPGDFAEFASKAAHIYRWFKVKPVILGSAPIRDSDFYIQGSNYFLSEYGSCSDVRSAQVLMGNVAYPLNAERLGSKNPMINSLISARVQVVMPIGSVMPTASREDLEYDNRTRENLTAALVGVGKELAELLYAKAREPAPCEWERHLRIQTFRKRLPAQFSHSWDTLLEQLDIDAEERRLIKSLYLDLHVTFPKWVGAGYSADSASLALVRAGSAAAGTLDIPQVWIVEEVERRNGPTIARKNVTAGNVSRGKNLEPAILSYGSTVEVIYANTTHAWPRIRAHAQEKGTSVVMVIGAFAGSKESVKRYAEDVARELGGLPVKGTSELPLPELIKARTAKPAVKREAYEQAYAKETAQYRSFLSRKQNADLKLTEVPQNGRYYLIKYSRRHHTYFQATIPEGGTKNLDYSDIDAIMMAYVALQKRGVPLPLLEGAITVDSGQASKLKLRDNGWKPLLETVIEAMSEKLVLKDLKKRLNNMPYLRRDHWYEHKHAGLVGLLVKSHASKDKVWQAYDAVKSSFPVLSSIVSQAIAANDAEDTGAGSRVHLRNFLDKLPLKLQYGVKQMDAEELGDLIHKAYPMTRFLDNDHFLRVATKRPDEAIMYLRQILVPADKLGLTAPIEEPQAIAS
jgi:hypothetical protein